ncbi:unnamed protein product [Lupinus luteus]|uniref:Uncharacterized protein n=1 Tax=Lupinus luteus TaxID=3873 RepID=A0AAV1Y6I5_LUPLU
MIKRVNLCYKSTAVACAPRPTGVACAPRRTGVACAPRPTGVTYAPRRTGVACAPRPTGVACAPRRTGVACAPRPTGVACAPRPTGVACAPRRTGVAYAPRPTGVAWPDMSHVPWPDNFSIKDSSFHISITNYGHTHVQIIHVMARNKRPHQCLVYSQQFDMKQMHGNCFHIKQHSKPSIHSRDVKYIGFSNVYISFTSWFIVFPFRHELNEFVRMVSLLSLLFLVYEMCKWF